MSTNSANRLRLVLPCCLFLYAGAAAGADPEADKPLRETLGAGEAMLMGEPGVSAWPLDFGQISPAKLPLLSVETGSWTSTRWLLEGMPATDPYQPGRSVTYPDLLGLREFSVEHSKPGEFPALKLQVARTRSVWHGSASVFGTSGAFAADNLPSAAERGNLNRPEKFTRFLHSNVQAGGPLTPWLDFLFSGSGRWSRQTVPLEETDDGMTLRSLSGVIRTRARISQKDQLDLLILGSRINTSGWAVPFAVEALNGRRMAPIIRPLKQLREEDHLDFVQLGWSRAGTSGEFQVRYGYSTAHTDSIANDRIDNGSEIVHVEMTDGSVRGGPFFQTQAVAPRNGVESVWRWRPQGGGWREHALTVTGGFSRVLSKNRLLNPPAVHAITAAAQPVSAIEFNLPLDARSVLRRTSLGFGDRIRIGRRLTFDFGLGYSGWNGSLPIQTSPPALREPARDIPGVPNLVSWHQVAPRLAVALNLGPAVLRAGYGRNYHALAGRHLDFGNSNSLSGMEYVWDDGNHDKVFQYWERTRLLRRFGGAYSSIVPQLKRPFADEYLASLEWKPSARSMVRTRWFTRNERNRIAALNTGVPFSAYEARNIADPGADFVQGTADDQTLKLYEQDPTTFGQDSFLLTNPGINMKQHGFLIEGESTTESFFLKGSLLAAKSWGLTNPGSAVWENDSGVVGALFSDPNSMTFATGRPALDRGWLGKITGRYSAPKQLGHLELYNFVLFTGGRPYGRRLLVTGLSQGPILAAAGPRGGKAGYRTDAIVSWNVRIARSFEMPTGILRWSIDIHNLLNRNAALQEEELSGPGFAGSSPLALQPPRFLRMGLAWNF